MIELTFLKESILIRKKHQRRLIFATIGIFLDKEFRFQPDVCNRCHDILMMSMKCSDIAIINIYRVSY